MQLEKRLTLLRHADAEPGNLSKSDYGRALSAKGQQQSQALHQRLQDTPFHQILCSPALRTKETASLALRQNSSIVYEPALYQASCDVILDFIDKATEDCRDLLIVAHNPGIHECALTLSRFDESALAAKLLTGFPAATMAIFAVKTRWNEIMHKRPCLIELITS